LKSGIDKHFFILLFNFHLNLNFHKKGSITVELRAYWAILVRRFWIIALVVGVVALYSAYQYYHIYKTPGALKAYQSTTTIRIGLLDKAKPTDPNYADYVTSSQALADEFATGLVFTTPEFTKQIVQQIQSEQSQIQQRFPGQDLGDITNAGAIGSSFTATRNYNLVTLNVVWSSPAGAWAIADATGKVSTNNIGQYLDFVVRPYTNADGQGQDMPSAEVASSPSDPVATPGPSANKPLILLALIAVALVIGLALAFLIEYLDDRIRSAYEAENLLQLPVYGEIPHAPVPGKERTRPSPI
jgi:capsular polysaccharide biosynthesis protein